MNHVLSGLASEHLEEWKPEKFPLGELLLDLTPYLPVYKDQKPAQTSKFIMSRGNPKQQKKIHAAHNVQE